MRVLIYILLLFTNILLFFHATSYGNDYFRGHLVLGHEVRSFTPCERNVEYWVLDQTGGDLWKVYKELTHQPYQPIYVEVLGHLGSPPVDGFGADYDRQVTVRELRRAGIETPGCAEDLKNILFRASGNEPFWNAQISENSIIFSEMGKPQLSFPSPHPEVSDNRWAFVSKTQAPDQHDIRISITAKKCSDTMSGELFSFSAQVGLDGNKYVGCAREGWPRPALKDPSYREKPKVALDLPPTSGILTLDVLKNAVYQSEFSANGKVKLTNGFYREKIVPESATDLVITLSDTVAYGDLNGDGMEDAAGILITNSGGSGTFRHLAVVLNQEGSPRHVASLLLGDRVKVRSLTVRSGEVAVDMITQGPKDPLCCPTLEATQYYFLQGDRLVNAQEPMLTNKKWVLQSFGTMGLEEKPLPDTEISITFSLDGRLHGSGGCNRYFSAYEIKSDNSLIIKQIGSTRMACPQKIMDQEMRYFRSLQNVSTFKLEEQYLQLFIGKGDLFFVFNESEPKKQ
jgi:uncharacterized membrane protein/heat shock protein HslJ